MDGFLVERDGARRRPRRERRHAAALGRGDVDDALAFLCFAGGLEETGRLREAGLDAAELVLIEVIEEDVEVDGTLQVLGVEAPRRRHRRVVDGEDGDGVAAVDLRRRAGAGQGVAELGEPWVRREDARDVVACGGAMAQRRRRAEDDEEEGEEDAGGENYCAQGNGRFHRVFLGRSVWLCSREWKEGFRTPYM